MKNLRSVITIDISSIIFLNISLCPGNCSLCRFSRFINLFLLKTFAAFGPLSEALKWLQQYNWCVISGAPLKKQCNGLFLCLTKKWLTLQHIVSLLHLVFHISLLPSKSEYTKVWYFLENSPLQYGCEYAKTVST